MWLRVKQCLLIQTKKPRAWLVPHTLLRYLGHGQDGAVAQVAAFKGGVLPCPLAGDGEEADGEGFAEAVGHDGGVAHEGCGFFGQGVARDGDGVEADAAGAAVCEQGADVEAAFAGGLGESFVFGGGEHEATEALHGYVLRFEHAGKQGGGFDCAGRAEVGDAQQAVDFGHGGAVFRGGGGGVDAGVCPAAAEGGLGGGGVDAGCVVLQGVAHGGVGRLKIGGVFFGAVVQGAQGGGEQIGGFEADDEAVAVFAAVVAGGEVGDERRAVEVDGEVEVAFAARGGQGGLADGFGAAEDGFVVGQTVFVGSDVDAGVAQVAEFADEFGQEGDFGGVAGFAGGKADA